MNILEKRSGWVKSVQIGEESSHENQKKPLRFWDKESVMTENDEVWNKGEEEEFYEREELEEKTNK